MGNLLHVTDIASEATFVTQKECTLLKEIGILVSAVLGFLGLFGWSHKRLGQRIEELEKHSRIVLTEDKIRQIIDDKMAPIKVEYRSLSGRLDEIRAMIIRLETKIDKYDK